MLSGESQTGLDCGTLYLAMFDFRRLTSSWSCFNLSWRYLGKKKPTHNKDGHGGEMKPTG